MSDPIEIAPSDDPDDVTELVTFEGYVGGTDDQYLAFILDPDGTVIVKVTDDGENRMRWTGTFSTKAIDNLVQWYAKKRGWTLLTSPLPPETP